MVFGHATLNLASLLKHGLHGESEVEGEGFLMPDEEILRSDDLILAEPLAWHLNVRATGGDEDFLLSGTVSGVAVLACRRCLTEVKTAVETELFYPMAYRPGTKGLHLIVEDDEEILVFGQPEVDFAALLAEVFAVDLPLTVLCQAQCKGLSPEGVNLNDHPEAERRDSARPDSPFKSLQDLDLQE